jgi:DNA-binding HxlR family transcriptional regulator
MRHPQFCALARAAEVVAERWTLLIVRELLLGPKRFVDLRERLDGVSPSVLTARLARAEKVGLVRRRLLPPPAASTVYELTEHGQALRPAIYELIRWGGRFLFPMRRGDRAEPEWAHLALAACARRGPVPARAIRLRIVGRNAAEAVLRVAGGASGTTVGPDAEPADVTITADLPAVLGLMSGALDPDVAVRTRRIAVTGDRAAVRDFHRLFDVTPLTAAGLEGARR